jgi:DnaJ-class molecular chaperone
MRFLSEIVIAGVLLWLGWNTTFHDWIFGPPPPPSPPAPLAVAVPKTPVGQKIICPACKGEGVVVFDSTGSRRTIDHRTQPCPVCLGKGYRILVIPKGKQVCPDCQGMGIVFYPEEPGHPIRSDNCARCGATGVVAAIR